MLADVDLLAWYTKLGLTERVRVVIDHIRSSGPARRVGGGRRNVSGRYPSKKMGVTVQFESHRVELAAVYELEHDPDVLEYFDQPPSFKLDYDSADGRRMGVLHTADYFVIRSGSAGWEECKTEEELVLLNRKNPNRFACDAKGRWVCPPGETYAAALGLYYRVRSSRDIDWVYQRNIQFLEDYLRAEVSSAHHGHEVVLAHLAVAPGISLDQLFELTASTVARDDIYSMIAHGAIYVNLRSEALTEPSRVRVFTSKEAAAEASQLNDTKTALPTSAMAITGDSLTWDGKRWKILTVGETSISLLSDDHVLTNVPLVAFENAVRTGHIFLSSPEESHRNAEVLKRLATANERELRIANGRLRHVIGFLSGHQPATDDLVPSRTLRRWVALYRAAENELGSGYLGLLPASHTETPRRSYQKNRGR